jgi:hypothetical protein
MIPLASGFIEADDPIITRESEYRRAEDYRRALFRSERRVAALADLKRDLARQANVDWPGGCIVLGVPEDHVDDEPCRMGTCGCRVPQHRRAAP